MRMWRMVVFLAFVGTSQVVGRLVLKHKNFASVRQNAVQSDVSDYGNSVCTPGEKFPIPDDICKYRICNHGKLVEQQCQDGMSFSRYGKACRPDKKCTKSLTERGVGNIDTSVCGFDLLFALDMSVSIGTLNKRKIMLSVLAALEKLELGGGAVHVGGLTYGNETYEFLKLSSFNKGDNIVNAVKGMQTKTYKGTASWLALRYLRETLLSVTNGRRKGKKAIVVFVTDGVSNPHEMTNETIEQAKKLKDPESYKDEDVSPPEVYLFYVTKEHPGLGERKKTELEDIKKEEFKNIPSEGKQYFHEIGFKELEETLKSILPETCIII